ncbi:MAG: stage V sporulation protein AE [Oscillospiraceae bacterium]|jgi:stage V sporulation protein AE|nr:stage V sporulation protein AE [Oscillospiraceae bacterium]
MLELIFEYLKAFAIGGGICVVGQILIDKTRLTPARIMVGFVVLGVILGGTGVYEPFAEFAGAGATVPILGFGNALAQGVKKAMAEHGVLGILMGVITATAGGIAASIFFGLLTSLVAKPGDRTK